MKRLLFIIISILLAAPAFGQVSRGVTQTVDPTYANSSDHPLRLDDIGQLYVRGSFAPSTSSTIGIAPVVTATAASSKVLKASAGNLYGYTGTSGASAGYFLVYDLTAAPSNGTVTPVDCVSVPATTTIGVNYSPPLVMAAGATVAFSTTGCFTQTLSATAFISGEAK